MDRRFPRIFLATSKRGMLNIWQQSISQESAKTLELETISYSKEDCVSNIRFVNAQLLKQYKGVLLPDRNSCKIFRVLSW